MFILIFCLLSQAVSITVYLDPESLSDLVDGTENNPYKSLSQVLRDPTVNGTDIMIIRNNIIINDSELLFGRMIKLIGNGRSCDKISISFETGGSFILNNSSFELVNVSISIAYAYSIVALVHSSNNSKIVLKDVNFNNMVLERSNILSFILAAGSFLYLERISFYNLTMAFSALISIEGATSVEIYESQFQLIKQSNLSTRPLLNFIGTHAGIVTIQNSNFLRLIINNNIIKVSGTQHVVLLQNISFVDNWVRETAVSSDGSINFTAVNVLFLRQNLANEIRQPNGGNCLTLKNNLEKFLIKLNLTNCYSDKTAVGVKIFDDSSSEQLYRDMLKEPKDCSFRGNYIFYEKAYEIGCSLLISSSSALIVSNCTFMNNTINTTDSNNQKAGGPCLVSGSSKSQLTIKNSIFIENRARFSSNCLFVSGQVFINASKFLHNFPLISNAVFIAFKNKIGSPRNIMESHGEIGGAIISIADKFVLSFSFIKGSGSLFGGGIFININLENSRSLYLRIENSIFQENLAGVYGGHVFIFEGMIQLDSIIRNCVFDQGDAHFGAGISTYWKTDSASIVLLSSIFSNNVASYGAAIDFSHSGGNSDVVSNMFVNNSGFNPASGLGACSVLKLLGTLNLLAKLYNNTMLNNIASYKTIVSVGSARLFDFNSTHYYGESTEGSVVAAILGSKIDIRGMIAKNIRARKNAACFLIKERSFLNISDSLFEANTAPGSGGVILSSERNYIYFNNVSFKNNKASTGGILLAFENFNEYGAIIVFRECIFELNNASTDLFSVADTTLAFYNATFLSHTVNLFSLTSSSLTFEEISIESVSCDLEISGCIFSVISNASLIGHGLTITNITSKREGAIIYSEESYVNITSIRAKNYSSENLGVFLYATCSKVLLQNGSFSRYSTNNLYVSSSVLFLEGLEFTGNPGNTQEFFLPFGCIYIEDPISTITIKLSNFSDNNALSYGGALYLSSQNESPNSKHIVEIIGCSFVRNTAGINGGAIHISNQAFSIEGCFYQNNKAQNGGAIYIDSLEEDTTPILQAIKHSHFIENQAMLEGGAIKWTFARPQNFNNTFQSNIAVYGQNEAAFPMKLTLTVKKKGGLENETIYGAGLDDDILNLKELVSGQEMPFIFIFEIKDFYNKTVTTINDGSFSVDFLEEQFQEESPGSNKWNRSGYKYISRTNRITEGKIIIEDLKIVVRPSSKIMLKLSSSHIKKYYKSDLVYDFPNRKWINISNQYHYLISLEFRDCLRGEIFQESINSCYKCPEGKFTLENPEKAFSCFNCLPNAICKGGEEIYLHTGYWRTSNRSSEIFDCKRNREFCLGGRNSNCTEGYTGPLCGVCDVKGRTKYSRISKYCVPCLEFTVNFIRVACSFLGFMGIVAFMVLAAIKDAEKIGQNPDDEPISLKEFLSIYLKIFLNYIQVISVLSNMDLRWPFYARNFTEAQSNIGNVPSHIISIECLLLEGNLATPAIYYRALAAALVPILLQTIFVIFLATIWQIKKRSQSTNIIISYVVVGIFLQPTVMRELTDLISCTEIGKNKFYLSRSMDVECYTPEHKGWIYGLAFPMLAYWVIIYPLGCLSYLVKNSKNLKEPLIRKRMGFFMSGYKRRYFYWEFLIMYRKVCIVLVSTISDIPILVRAFALLLISAISFYVTVVKRPFGISELNNLEIKSNICALITLYSGIFYSYTDVDGVRAFFFLILATTNAIFLLIWVKSVVSISLSANSKTFHHMCPAFMDRYNSCFRAIGRIFLRKSNTESDEGTSQSAKEVC